MFEIRPAVSTDVPAAIATLVDAFEHDALMLYLFAKHPVGIRAGIQTFFSILLRARIALDAPAEVLVLDGEIRGVVMGNHTSPPAWPTELDKEWLQFSESVREFNDRLEAYESICVTHEPSEDHYYLGVIGVHPSLQGKGAGKALLDSFCERSRADPKSRGVYLDTANPASLEFYYKNGFVHRGEGQLDGARLWCVYRRT